MSINRCYHSRKADGQKGMIMDGGFACAVCYPWFGDACISPIDMFPDYPWTDEELQRPQGKTLFEDPIYIDDAIEDYIMDEKELFEFLAKMNPRPEKKPIADEAKKFLKDTFEKKLRTKK